MQEPENKQDHDDEEEQQRDGGGQGGGSSDFDDADLDESIAARKGAQAGADASVRCSESVRRL